MLTGVAEVSRITESNANPPKIMRAARFDAKTGI